MGGQRHMEGAQDMTTQSQLIRSPYILKMTGENDIVKNGALLIEGRKISKILSSEEADKIENGVDEVIRKDSHIIMPGLVNLHGHSAMTLLRGYADDLKLMDWLNNHIWPLEGKHVSGEFVYDGTLVAMAEMLLGGTTTINDMYFFHAFVGKAASITGMRTMIGCSIMEFPTNYANNPDEYIKFSLDTEVAFMGFNRLKFVLAPHAPYTVSDDTFRKVVEIAEKYDMLIHCHVLETQDEIEKSMAEHGMKPLQRLDKLGVLSNRLIAAHMVHLDDEDIELTAKRGVSIAHNPGSNMKLASGFANVQKYLDNGINVGLGTDGAASNNRLDMFGEMYLASLIAKGSTGNPVALKAYDVLKMATINGAKALHLDKKIGTIEEGKDADIIAVNYDDIGMMPLFNPVSHLVYAANRRDVTDTWVEGERLVKDGELTRVKLDWIKEKAEKWREIILKG